MIKQSWEVVLDGETHKVEYKFSRFCGKTVLVVDGDEFAVKGKPFGIGVQRHEPVIVGMCQAILSVSRNGRAALIVRDATEVTEIK